MKYKFNSGENEGQRLAAFLATLPVAGILIFKYKEKRKQKEALFKSDLRRKENLEKSQLRQEVECAKSSNRRAEAELKAALQKEIIEKRGEVAIRLAEGKKRNRQMNSSETDLLNDQWIAWFNANYKKPKYIPPSIKPIIKACPKDYDIPMLFMLLSAFGALCFSQVRAVGVDGNTHRPLLQVIIVGAAGSGKGKINDVYQLVFHDLIEADNSKQEGIIQIIGTNTTRPELIKILAGNMDMICFLLDPEVASLKDSRSRRGALTPEILRKTFDGDTTSQRNQAPNAPQGDFHVLINFVITGTQGAINKAFPDGDVEGGSTSRIMWSVIPSIKKLPPKMGTIPNEEMKIIRTFVLDCRKYFCYYVDELGKEVVTPETIIEMPEVCKVLEHWKRKQSKLQNDRARKGQLGRVCTIAFRSAMVLYMLCGQPQDREKMKHICDWTEYIANYCMERYLFLYGENHWEMYFEKRDITSANYKGAKKPSDDMVAEWVELHDRPDLDNKGQRYWGWGRIAKEHGYGFSKDSIRRAVLNLKRN